MKLFYGTKKLKAQPMTRGEYNRYRNWVPPVDEDQTVDGYLVEYTDGGQPNDERHKGYISWSPKEQFENAYQPLTALSFGHAIAALKAGEKVARAGWNGRGMFLYYVPAASYPAQTRVATNYWGSKSDRQIEPKYNQPMVPYGAYIAMKTAQENVVPWLASQTDVLADDWQIVE